MFARCAMCLPICRLFLALRAAVLRMARGALLELEVSLGTISDRLRCVFGVYLGESGVLESLGVILSARLGSALGCGECCGL